MKTLLPLFPFVAALGLLACQGNDGPVAEGATAVPDQIVGDGAASGPDSSANAAPNAAAAEAADRAAAPPPINGMAWSSNAEGSAIAYGPSGARPMLTFACTGSGNARHLLVTRAHPAHDGKTATISFTGGGHASSLPVHAVAKPGGPGESEWQGEARGDMARAVGRAFSGAGLVNVTLGGAPALALPASPLVPRLVARCA